jgi:hypothetical protein
MAEPSQSVKAVEEHLHTTLRASIDSEVVPISKPRGSSQHLNVLQDHGPRSGPSDLPGAHYAIARRTRTAHHTRDEIDDTENDDDTL